MDFRNLENRGKGPPFQFRISHLLLMVVWVSIVLALSHYPECAAIAGSLMILAYLHRLSEGRTSPIAAFTCVGAWALAAALGGAPFVLAALRGSESVRTITDEHFNYFFVTTFSIGLSIAALAAIIAAYDKRHECL